VITTLSVVIVLYCLSVTSVLTLFYLANGRIERELVSRNKAAVVSIAWAWMPLKDVLKLKEYWGDHRFGNIERHNQIIRSRLFVPHTVFLIGLIICYQAFLRRGSIFSMGPCNSAPNCSNFAIGCLLRYPFHIAVAKMILRVNCCNSAQPMSFSENFQD